MTKGWRHLDCGCWQRHLHGDIVTSQVMDWFTVLLCEDHQPNTTPAREKGMPLTADHEMTELEELMAEPPGGHNHGRAKSMGLSQSGEAGGERPRALDTQADSSRFLGSDEGGWSVVSIKGGVAGTGGLTSHRGVLHPAEYVNHEALVRKLETVLGASFEELRAMFTERGRPTAEASRRRAAVMDRLITSSGERGNISLLAAVLGVERTVVLRAVRDARRRRGE